MFTKNLLLLVGIIIFTIIIMNKGKYKKFKETFTVCEEQEINGIRSDITDIKKDIKFLKDKLKEYDLKKIRQDLDRNTQDLCKIKKKMNEIAKSASETSKEDISLPFSNLTMC